MGGILDSRTGLTIRSSRIDSEEVEGGSMDWTDEELHDTPHERVDDTRGRLQELLSDTELNETERRRGHVHLKRTRRGGECDPYIERLGRPIYSVWSEYPMPKSSPRAS